MSESSIEVGVPDGIDPRPAPVVAPDGTEDRIELGKLGSAP